MTKVPQLQYEQEMGTNPSFFLAMSEGKEAVASLETGNHPVETVSWYDAAEFCGKTEPAGEAETAITALGNTVRFSFSAVPATAGGGPEL